ncbi:MAG: DUF6116 family protein [Gammaproteobacteria bacterium]
MNDKDLVKRSVEKHTAGLRFPRLFFIVCTLLVVDLLLPDFVPFIDEIILGLVAVVLGTLKERARERRGEPKDITPRGD